MLSYIALDLASNDQYRFGHDTMEITFNSLVQEAYSDFDLSLWLLMYNTTAIDHLNTNRPIYPSSFDFSSFDLADMLRNGGRIDITEAFVNELNNPDFDLSSFNLQEMINTLYGDGHMNDIRDWEPVMMFQSLINYINANSVSDDGWYNDFVIEYNDCYWYDKDCTEEEERFYQCYWYDIGCPDDKPKTTDDQGFEHWIDCWENTSSWCSDEDPTGKYYDCYMYGDRCEDPIWYDCYWYGDCGEHNSNQHIDTMEEWLECWRNTRYLECGENHSEYYDCYMYEEGC